MSNANRWIDFVKQFLIFCMLKGTESKSIHIHYLPHGIAGAFYFRGLLFAKLEQGCMKAPLLRTFLRQLLFEKMESTRMMAAKTLRGESQ